MAITNASRLADFGSGIGTQGAIIQVDNAGQEVGIGTTNPNATLTVGNIGASGTSIYVHGDGRITGVLTATTFSGAVNASGISTVGVLTAYSAISADAGIDFSGINNATAGMTSETLDAYEEGTWTPAPEFGGGTTGITGTFVGRYTKIGRVVELTYNLTFTDKGSSTGSFKISGLPFGINANTYNGTGFSYIHRLTAAQTNGQLTGSVTGSTCGFKWAGYSDANTTDVDDADLDDDSAIYGSITYFTTT